MSEGVKPDSATSASADTQDWADLYEYYQKNRKGRNRCSKQVDESLEDQFAENRDKDDVDILSDIPDGLLSNRNTQTFSPRNSTGRLSRHSYGTGRMSGRYTQDQLDHVNYKRVNGAGLSDRATGTRRTNDSCATAGEGHRSSTPQYPNEDDVDGILFEMPAGEPPASPRRRARMSSGMAGIHREGQFNATASHSTASSSTAPACTSKLPIRSRENGLNKHRAARFVPADSGRLDTIQSLDSYMTAESALSPGSRTSTFHSFPELDPVPSDLKNLHEKDEPDLEAHAVDHMKVPIREVDGEDRISGACESDDSQLTTSAHVLMERLTLESLANDAASSLDREVQVCSTMKCEKVEKIDPEGVSLDLENSNSRHLLVVKPADPKVTHQGDDAASDNFVGDRLSAIEPRDPSREAQSPLTRRLRMQFDGGGRHISGCHNGMISSADVRLV